jgi:putative peptidoglycan lipid II flippase
MFPFLLLVALAAVAMGMLNAKDRFGVAASASSFFNLGSVAIGLACAWWLSPDYMRAMWHGSAAARSALPPTGIERAILGMAFGTLAGGALQLLVQLPSLRRLNYRYRPMLSFRDPGVRQVLALMAPATIGAAAVQVNVLVNSNFASYLGDGPVSWLNVAFRFMQLPIGLFGVAVGTVALPAVSRSVARDNLTEFRQTIVRALRMVFCLTIPAAVGLAVLAPETIGLVYQHGRFGPHDTQMAARALVAYSFGLAGYANIKVLVPAFYALGDARTPMLVSLLSILVNALLNWLTIHWLGLGHTGLALATSSVALLNFAILFVIIRGRIGALPGLGAALARISVAAAALGLVCLGLKEGIGILLPSGSFTGRMLVSLLAIPGGVVAFVVVAALLGLSEIGMLLRPLRRWRPA